GTNKGAVYMFDNDRLIINWGDDALYLATWLIDCEQRAAAARDVSHMVYRPAGFTPRCEKKRDVFFGGRVVPFPPLRMIEPMLNIDYDQRRVSG
ncbi:MAG: hypothetical protein M3N13_06570, partial [Candidatus Eremiobacteraeota bacterium]|nr:hypothetical protein [Candidatus Eremiobacteraeota bacterium]